MPDCFATHEEMLNPKTAASPAKKSEAATIPAGPRLNLDYLKVQQGNLVKIFWHGPLQ